MSRKLEKILILLCAVVFVIGGLFSINAIGNSASSAKKETNRIPQTSGKTYYVDAEAKEGNDGLSPKKALKTLEEVNNLELKPGDQVLFKRDCIWNGGLIVKNSGTADAPIAFDAYGEGENLPVLAGNGQVHATIFGQDVSFIEVRNLEVTNESDFSRYIRGIFFNALYKDVEGIRILNNYVHDVDGCWKEAYKQDYWNDRHWFGGIVVKAGGSENREEKVIVHDILIQENLVEKCSGMGIVAGGTTATWARSTKIVVRENYVKENVLDGIVLFATDGGLIEGNVADHNGTVDQETETDYHTAIWIAWSDNGIIQYNEAFGQGVGGDSCGFDIDLQNTNTILQYNYSHDNYGGFLLMMERNNGKAIVRYNISQNDGAGGRLMKIHFVPQSNHYRYLQAEIYNNTFYTNQPLDNLIHTNDYIHERVFVRLTNNIFCYTGSTNPTLFPRTQDDRYATFENNYWQGFATRDLPEGEKNSIVGENPMFSYAGAGANGMDTVTGYQLLAKSPCLGTGKQIHNNGGLDYFGNELTDTVNIGAYAGASVKKPKGVNLALVQAADMSSVNALPILKEMTIEKLVDGQADESVATKPADKADAKAWFEINIEEDYELSKVVLKVGEDASLFPKDFTIEVWDGEEWKQVIKENNYKIPKGNSSVEFKFESIKGSKVRLNVTEMRANEDGKYAAQLSEIEIYE